MSQSRLLTVLKHGWDLLINNTYGTLLVPRKCDCRRARRRMLRFSGDLCNTLIIIRLNVRSAILCRRNSDREQLAFVRSPKLNFVDHWFYPLKKLRRAECRSPINNSARAVPPEDSTRRRTDFSWMGWKGLKVGSSTACRFC